jgi:hypothetical protein
VLEDKMKRPNEPREKIIGSDTGPEQPFPLRISGKVIPGFQRGSKEVSLTLFAGLLQGKEIQVIWICIGDIFAVSQ